jgi:predicted O-methyltransferase YrrM
MALRIITPWGIEWWLHHRQPRSLWRQARREVQAAEVKAPRSVPVGDEFVEEAIQFLLQRGLERDVVLGFSIPAASLRYMAEAVSPRLPADGPLRVLHIGNFVGISLSYMSRLVRDRHPDSVVVSIDPNTAHPEARIRDPQNLVIALLQHFGLLANNVIIPGYTLERTEVDLALACENVLRSLKRVDVAGFDLVVIDGNHDETYLSREFAALRDLLATRSIVVFDDVGHLDGVLNVFRRVLEDQSCVPIGEDGRVGIVEVLSRGATGSDPAPESEAPLRSRP